MYLCLQNTYNLVFLLNKNTNNIKLKFSTILIFIYYIFDTSKKFIKSMFIK